MSLLCIGTLAYDTIETPTDRRENALGGSATYFCVAAAPFAKARLVGVVGTDFRDEDRQLLVDKEVCVEGLEVADGETFTWGGRYEADWNTRHTLFTNLNVFEHFDPKVPEGYRDSRFVFLANAHPAIQLKALLQVAKPEFTVADTMNLWIDIALDDLKELLKHIDGLILNDEEARMLTGESNLILAARKVLTMGPKTVILKKGEHGAFIIGDDVHFSLPAYPVTDVIDPTGAGDSFAGGFMGAIAKAGNTDPATLRRAMVAGTATASFCVQGFSLEDIGRRTGDDVEGRIQDLLQIVTV